MLTLKPDAAAKAAPFNINAPVREGAPHARLPIPDRNLRQFSLDVPTYLEAMKASVEGINKAGESALTEVVKALGVPPTAYSFATMSFMPDPANAGLLPWPGIAPESLQKIARENIAPQLVIRSRVADLARYSGLSTQLWEPGWSIGMRDPKERPNTQDKEDIKAAERFIWNCNRETSDDARQRDQNLLHPFDMFLRQFGDDTHKYDGWAIWTDMDRMGRVRAFANLPAGNIRLAIPGRGYSGNPKYFAALVDDTGNPVRPFTRDTLTWSVRNPRTDPNTWGYGWSELEIAVVMIQAFQNGIQLNSDTFSRNSIPNGMLLLKGDFFNQDQIDALMREWTSMKRGISKSWGMPVMSIPEDSEVDILNFMDLKGEEIRYKDHLNLMGGLYCVINNFPPSRLGIFASGQHRDNKPSPNESTEIAGVDDNGLPALLGFAANRINEYLLWPNWNRLRFRFNGANPKQDAREYEARKLARTWGETRVEVDLPKLTTGVPEENRPLMEVMSLCPEDPAKAGVFQTLATKWLELQAGGEESEGAVEGGPGAKDTNKVGAPFPSKADPAQSLSHGHRAGVRRDGAKEKKQAEPKAKEPAV